MDTHSPEIRRKNMQAVKSKNTRPELTVRKALFALGYRFRLHRRDLPGSPDIVFPSKKKVIFVHGCFWHGHDCRRGRAPKSHKEFWNDKLKRNYARDERNREELARMGWRAFNAWECEIKEIETLLPRLQTFLDED